MKEVFFMNYAEGQNAPKFKFTDEKEANAEAKRLAEKLGVKVTTLKAYAQVEPKDIKARVKSYADACAVLGIPQQEDAILAKLGFTEDEIARRKLHTIAQALNEGWSPNWNDTNEYKYYPWFYIQPNLFGGHAYNGANAGLGSAGTYYAAAGTGAAVGTRLCFKTSALARYAGEQFTDLYTEILVK